MAVFDMEHNKASGTDGFLADFYQFFECGKAKPNEALC